MKVFLWTMVVLSFLLGLYFVPGPFAIVIGGICLVMLFSMM